ncbi:hypothetical protein BKA62DRAFT_220039 [Auriculariales sp. MPI-PUGE-AT-0066]|nr:hypothetical protein BKA62DRAFT_220039 [Auriculariales sp. MPI-PUGE-AT-0066]
MKAESATPPSDESPDALHSSADKPERSRNAKAQARHRAKRKAYIESLEQTVARLQAAVSGTSDSHSRVTDLEQENLRLRSENDMLKVQLGFSPLDSARRPSGATGLHGGSYPSNATGDAHRDLKRRRTSADGTGDPSPSFLASPFIPCNPSTGGHLHTGRSHAIRRES